MAEVLLTVENLSKTFKTDFWKKPFRAVQDISFEVEKGKVVGIVGPNGAGKTTAIKMVLGITKPTHGTVTLMGNSPFKPEARKMIGYLPESAYYYDYLNAYELLRFYGGIFGIKGDLLEQRVNSLLELVGLKQKAYLKLRGFSKGMLQRIGIAQALINDPQLVILDEPMSGLDPIGRKEVRDIILQLKAQGKTILFSSHILHDVEMLCESVVMIFQGKVVAKGDLDQLLSQRLRSVELQLKSETPLRLPDVLSTVCSMKNTGKIYDISLRDTDKIFDLLRVVESQKAELVSLSQHRDSLEELFMHFLKPQT